MAEVLLSERTSKDCYIRIYEDKNLRKWVIGNQGLERTLLYNSLSGEYTCSSFLNKLTSTEYITSDLTSAEFALGHKDELLSGESGIFLRPEGEDIKILPDDSMLLTVRMRNRQLRITLNYQIYPETAVLRKWLDIENISTKPFHIGGWLSSEILKFMLPSPNATEVYAVRGILDKEGEDLKLERRDLRDGDVFRFGSGRIPPEEIEDEYAFRHISDLHSGSLDIPWLVINDKREGEGIYVGLEWSGPWEVEIDSYRGYTHLQAGIDRRFTHWLIAGESISSAGAIIGFYKGGYEEACVSVQDFQERYLIPDMPSWWPHKLPPIEYNSWFWTEWFFNEGTMKEQARLAAELGIETFLVDAGWSISVGDKRVDRRKFPKGMRELSDYVNQLGMKLGLWVSLANFDPSASAYQLDWIVRDKGGGTFSDGWNRSQLACLASGYKDYIVEEIDSIVKRYNISWLKFDQHTFHHCYAPWHHHQNSEDAWFYQVLSFYEILDELRRRNPDLLIECCEGGGRIMDFGVFRRAHILWVHDDIRTYDSRRHFYGACGPFLPRYAIRWSTVDLSGDLEYKVRSAMMGAFGICSDLSALTTEQRERLVSCIRIYKERRREIDSPAYHLLPQPLDEARWDATLFVDKRSGEGMLFAFRGDSPDDSCHLKLRKLSPSAKYRIRSANSKDVIGEIEGKELLKEGMKVNILDGTKSDILFFEIMER